MESSSPHMDERKLSKFTKADCNLGSCEQKLLSLTGSKIGCQAKREKLVVSVVGLGLSYLCLTRSCFLCFVDH
jgi:hypothetical protein